MSRLRIIHDTVYRYGRPVSFGPHRLVLRPREGHDLNVAKMTLAVQPAFTLAWSRDIFGNSVGIVTLLEPSDVLHIRSEVVLDRPEHAVLGHVGALEYPVSYGPLEAPATAVYLAPSYPDDAGAVRAFVFETLRLAPTGNVAEALEQLNGEIHTRFAYRRREEKGVQTPARTLSLGTGSCRDKATLFLDCARVLGIATRFASGYLDCKASEAGRAATHAWAEAYLPENGWCGFDPTIGKTTGDDHVVVGVSAHPRGVMPVSGKFTGSADDFLGLEVAVRMERLTNRAAE